MYRLHALLTLLVLVVGRPVFGDTAVVTTVADEPGTSFVYLSTDASGNVYYGDTHGVYRRTPAGTTARIAPIVAWPYLASDGPLGKAGLAARGPLTVASDGTVYVADNGAIRKIAVDGSITTLAGKLSDHLVYGGVPTDGIGAAAVFGGISHLAVDTQGNVYVSDGGLRKVSPDGHVTSLLAAVVDSSGNYTTSWYFAALATDAADRLYVIDSRAVVDRVEPDGTLTPIAGGSPGFSHDGKGVEASLFSPGTLTVAHDGALWVVDGLMLRRITPDGVVTTLAGYDTLSVDYSGRRVDGTGGEARFSQILGIAPIGEHDVLVADGYSTLRRASFSSGVGLPVIVFDWTFSLQTLGAGQSFQTQVYVNGTGSFQWLHDGNPVAGATATTLALSSVTAADAGSYQLRISNAAGSELTTPFSLQIFTPAFGGFTARHVDGSGSFLWGIASGGGQLVAVGTSGKILTSRDGIEWRVQASGTTEWLVGVTYANGKYIVVGDHGTILVSDDAVAWHKAASSGTAERLNNVAFGNGMYVSVGEHGTVLTSSDAETWTVQSVTAQAPVGWLRALVYVPAVRLPAGSSGDNGTGAFYAGGQDGVILHGDAAGWRAEYNYGGKNDIEAFADGPIGVGQNGGITNLYSYTVGMWNPNGSGYYVHAWNGASWVGLNARFRGLAVGAGAIFATGEGGEIAAAPAANGPWVFVPSGTTANLVAGAFHGNSLFIVGENETILQSELLFPSRLIDISSRGRAGGGDDAMVSGFVVTGSSSKQILVRAAGPALAPFGIGDPLQTPVLTVYDKAGNSIATNEGWSSALNADAIAATSRAVSAFPFARGSADAALLLTLPPATYTLSVTKGTAAASGVSLFEVYDADGAANGASKAINLSTRGHVGKGEDKLIAGFAIGGAASRRVLIRGVGPALNAFGFGGVLAKPKLELYDSQQHILHTALAWTAEKNASEILDAVALTGAFPLPQSGADASMVVTLPPGTYSAHLSGADDGTGLAMIEIYDLP